MGSTPDGRVHSAEVSSPATQKRGLHPVSGLSGWLQKSSAVLRHLEMPSRPEVWNHFYHSKRRIPHPSQGSPLAGSRKGPGRQALPRFPSPPGGLRLPVGALAQGPRPPAEDAGRPGLPPRPRPLPADRPRRSAPARPAGLGCSCAPGVVAALASRTPQDGWLDPPRSLGPRDRAGTCGSAPGPGTARRGQRPGWARPSRGSAGGGGAAGEGARPPAGRSQFWAPSARSAQLGPPGRRPRPARPRPLGPRAFLGRHLCDSLTSPAGFLRAWEHCPARFNSLPNLHRPASMPLGRESEPPPPLRAAGNSALAATWPS